MSQTSYDFKVESDPYIEKMYMVNFAKNELDIRSYVVECNIYHDITLPFASGDMIIQESSGFREFFPLVGVETFVIAWKPSADSKQPLYEAEFIVYSLEKLDNSGGSTASYLVKFVEKEMFLNIDKKIAYCFKDSTPNVIIEDVMKKCFETPDDKLDLAPESWFKYNGEYTIVVPSWRPFQLFSHLCDTSVNVDNNSPDFLFYKDTDGMYKLHNFKKLVGEGGEQDKPGAAISPSGKQVPESKEEYYTLQVKQVQASSYDASDIDLPHIIKWEMPVYFNTLEDRSSGIANVRRLMVDMMNKSYADEDVAKQQLLDGTYGTNKAGSSDESLGESVQRVLHDALSWITGKKESPTDSQPQGKNTNEDWSFYKLCLVGLSPYTDISKALDYMEMRLPIMRMNMHYKINLELHGATRYRLGDRVNITIPSYIANDETGEIHEEVKDKYLSGKCVITRIKHSFNMASSRTYIEACKIALGDFENMGNDAEEWNKSVVYGG